MGVVQRLYMTCKVLCIEVKATVNALVNDRSGIVAVVLHNNHM